MNRISDTIYADHRELKLYYDQIIHSEDADEQTRWQNQFTWELARHVVGEELVLYPALNKYLHQDVAEDRQQHQTIKEELAVFQDLKATDPRFIPTLAVLMGDLAIHVNHEEVDLINLESSITGEQSRRLAASFDRTKHFVPTRAHPSAPDRPPYQTVVGLITAPLDHLQDLFRKWPESDEIVPGTLE
ncbi:HHE domain protein [Penicillium odoratum]|uniref:HHE domain protein n=1 Tax=Penicillium odoratum TaxID=1167516 RepID=UPI002547C1AA|nr:HHE domain protein [Penicillium odoratum]KAJ5777623.1 HHE domain protein [Penicillium odoratum]